MKMLEIFILLLSAWDSTSAADISVPDEVMGVAGEPFILSCGYDRRYQDNAKYLCRGRLYETCRVVVRTDGPVRRGRATISEDKSARTFSVSVTSLQWRDEGTYWCVISLPLRNAHAPVYVRVVQPAVKTTDGPRTNRPGAIRAPHSDSWSGLRWVLFFVMLACPVGVNLWNRRENVRRYCAALCSRLCGHTCPSLLPLFHQTE